MIYGPIASKNPLYSPDFVVSTTASLVLTTRYHLQKSKSKAAAKEEVKEAALAGLLGSTLAQHNAAHATIIYEDQPTRPTALPLSPLPKGVPTLATGAKAYTDAMLAAARTTDRANVPHKEDPYVGPYKTTIAFETTVYEEVPKGNNRAVIKHGVGQESTQG